ncbi:MAG: RHS repeat-associated core domain-containing protein [Oscillospiraceae bacterium]|nr:RHS repeat-associated core domain-containing protein [Oscillospiraceae bacterium]
MSYGNGAKLGYSYDKLERVSKVYYNGSTSPAVSYSYSSDGSLSRVDDHAANKEHIYNYDALGRLTSMTERSGANGVQMYRTGYDGANRVTSVEYKVSPAWNGTFMDARSYGYTYAAADGSLTKLTLPGSGVYTYSYDGLKRLTDRSLSIGGQSYMTRSYGYLDGTAQNSTTLIVGSLANRKADGSSINSYTYSYDDVGNITAISGSTNASYTYDAQGQLLTETYGGKTYTYTYDGAGNILSVSDGSTTKSYTYGDSNWKDLLTAYDGQAISYDAIGNPTSWYDGTTFGWSNGRRLTSAVNSSKGLNNSYTYDADGLRLTKTVSGEQHKYVWQGSTLVSEYYGGKSLEFFYDESGVPYGFSYKSSSSAAPAMYYYVTNLQGDVTNVLDASGNTVASYTYNAWGKLLSSSGAMASINPIRYRGYYFDSDTGLYYVSSRYYAPELGRFINADDVSMLGADGSVLSYNLFAYCLNNPVNRFEVDGNWSMPNWLKVTVGAVATVAAVAITVATGGVVLPVLIGVAASTAVGAVGNAIRHRLTTGSWDGTKDALLNGAADGFMAGGLFALGGSIIGGAVRTVKNARSGITIGKVGQFEEVAKIAKTRHYAGLNEYGFIKKTFGQKAAETIGWWQNKCVVKGVMALNGAIYDCGGALTGAYAKEIALTKGYKFLYNVWLM